MQKKKIEEKPNKVFFAPPAVKGTCGATKFTKNPPRPSDVKMSQKTQVRKERVNPVGLDESSEIKKSLMIGDSETDANAAKDAGIPVILLEDGYTEKNTTEIYHNHLVKDFIGIEKIVSKYL